jgi:hypothetical protein
MNLLTPPEKKLANRAAEPRRRVETDSTSRGDERATRSPPLTYRLFKRV